MYEMGVAWAFFLWLVNQARFFAAVNSQFERNLRKVGMRHSWLTLTPKPAEVGDWPVGAGGKLLKYCILAVCGLFGILLSWVTVALFVGALIYGLSKDAGAPAEVKELRWRMKNQDLTKEQIAEAFAKSVLGTEADKQRVKESLMAAQGL